MSLYVSFKDNNFLRKCKTLKIPATLEIFLTLLETCGHCAQKFEEKPKFCWISKKMSMNREIWLKNAPKNHKKKYNIMVKIAPKMWEIWKKMSQITKGMRKNVHMPSRVIWSRFRTADMFPTWSITHYWKHEKFYENGKSHDKR